MQKKRIYRGLNILLSIIFAVCIITYFSVRYYMLCWNVDFSIALYQLASPLKGTNPDYIADYLEIAATPSVIFLMVWFLGWRVSQTILISNRLRWNIRLIRRQYILRIHFKYLPVIKRILSILIIVAVLCNVIAAARTIGLFKYIEQSSNATMLYEDNYVDPEKVMLSFPEQKRNLVLIYLESMETTYMDEAVGGGKKENYIPELTDLAEENISFSNSDRLGGGLIVGRSGWTMAAILATSGGIAYQLPPEGNSAGNYSNFLPGLTSLGDILADNGYQNYFLCGSEAEFGGRELFYQIHGDYQIYDYVYALENGQEKEIDKTNWGYDDEKLFKYAKEHLTTIGNAGDPFNFAMLTVDTHHPSGYVCELCETQYEEQYANVLACSSRQTMEFIKWIEEQSWYEDTVIVILGDHLSMVTDFWDDIGDYERCTYNCFINTGKDLEQWELYHNRVFTTYDYFPTILSSLSVEIEGNRLGLGTDLFSGEETLAEKIGISELRKQMDGYSNYYMDVFVGGKKYD